MSDWFFQILGITEFINNLAGGNLLEVREKAVEEDNEVREMEKFMNKAIKTGNLKQEEMRRLRIRIMIMRALRSKRQGQDKQFIFAFERGIHLILNQFEDPFD